MENKAKPIQNVREIGRESESEYVSQYSQWCEGSRSASRYFLAFNVSAAKTGQRYGHPGSKMLDEINAFDLAEIERMNLGQLNLIRVSSFCGPQGIIWGYDVAVHPNLRQHRLFSLTDDFGNAVPIYSAASLMEAAAELFGTVRQKRFPIAPGSLCPAAWKSAASDQPGTVFACLALGIVKDRGHFACSLMEDAGLVPEDLRQQDQNWRGAIIESAARSVIGITKNQGTSCQEIFVAMATVDIEEGEVGCALLAAPYFSLARAAWPEGGLGRLRQVSLNRWKEEIS